MKYSFVEVAAFMQRRPEFFATDDEYREFQTSLSQAPEKGDVIRGCGGLRKIRWRDEKRGKGKRGGCRVIYLHFSPKCGEEGTIYLIYVYGKNEQDDLSVDERKFFKAIAEFLKKEETKKRGATKCQKRKRK